MKALAKSYNSLSLILQRFFFLWIIFALVMGACSPATGPKTVPDTERATQSVATQEPEPTAESQDSYLTVIDKGAPLPPQVIEQQPQGGQALSLNGPVLLTFDQPMDIKKTSLAWQMVDQDGAEISGKISWPSPRKLHFTPTAQLQENAFYQASLSAEAASIEGVSLSEPINFQFNTASALSVSQVFPADGAKDIENGAVITVIFNRPVVPLVIAEEKENLPDPLEISPAISGSGEWVNTSVYAFQPDEPLYGLTTYTVTVQAGLSNAAGDSKLDKDFSWQFTTTPPSIKSLSLSKEIINPRDPGDHILLDEFFIIDFYQPMDVISSQAALSLASEEDELEVITAWNEDFTQVVITPTQRLTLATSYTLELSNQAEAASGGNLLDGLHWRFTTVFPPAVSSVSPTDGGRQNTFDRQLRIRFISPMDIESVKERLILTPKSDDDIQWYYNEWNWSISAYILQPSTKYELRILPGMQDIYGNVINEGMTIRFTTGPYRPQAGLQIPHGTALLRQGAPQEFYVTSRNAGSYELKVFAIPPERFISLLSGRSESYSYAPKASDLVWATKEYYPGELNENVLKSHEPLTKAGQPLPPGFYFIGLDADKVNYERPYDDHRLLVIANANLTFKTNATESLAWLTDMESGEPLQGTSLTIYSERFNALGSGLTDKDGLLTINTPTPDDPYEDRFVLVSDGQVFAFASSQWGSGVSLYDFGIWGSYYSPPNQPKVYAYTDRPLYRPGQPVYFKGIVRLDDDLAYSLPEERQVSVTISNYKETVYEEDLPLSDFGSFEGQITLDTEAALGHYTLKVGLEDDDHIGSVGFSVAEYRKPEFQVIVSADPIQSLHGESFDVDIQADYYSGGGVAEAQVNWTLTAYSYQFPAPEKFSRYSFRNDEIDDYQRYGNGSSGGELIAEGQDSTDATGALHLAVPAELGEAGGSRRLVFEATVTDITQNAVSGRTEFIVHHSLVYPGVRSGRYVGQAGEEQNIDLVVVGWDGQPMADQVVDIKIVERRWYSIQEQDPNGQVRWTSSVEEILVKSFEDLELDATGQGQVSFIPPNGGIFRAIVIASDLQGNQASASAYMWVAGENYIPWRQTNDNSFELVTDRDQYTPGDTAEILIASPFQGQAYALVTVERGRTHYQDVVLLTSNSTIYKLPISESMAPNAYVSVIVIKGIDENNPHPGFKMGITEIQVNKEQKELTVEIEPDSQQAGPGEVVRYTVRTLDHQGEPVSAEVSLGLSDLATLSLLPSNSSPILDFFYAERSLGIWTSVSLGRSIEDYNAELAEDLVDEGLASGGGGGKGADDLGVVAVRQDFPDTAFWDAFVVTNQDGEATVVVTLPDNLTTWRMDARAVTENTLVGQATNDLISSKPLLVRPQTPRFFVAGDQASLGTAVRNNSEKFLNVDVSLQASGLTIEDAVSQTVRIPAGGQVFVTWNVVINENAERVNLVFSAEGGGLQDASRPPQGTLENQGIPVYRYQAPETVGTSGQMLEGGTLVEAISLPDNWQIKRGELTLQFSPSLAASMTDGLDFLEHYPYDCVEQTVSKFLPNAVSLRALKEAGLSDPELETALDQQIEIALQRLINWQNPDGGWGWWGRQESSPLTSAYVLLGLLEAQTSGYTVSKQVITSSLKFLRSQIKPVVRLTQPYLLNRQAFLLYVLARADQPDVSSSTQLYQARLNMALYARSYLAGTLYLIDPEDRRIDTLLSDLASAAILSASGAHWEEGRPDRYNWNNDTRTTAIVLATLSQIDPANPLNANAVRWLMDHRQNGYWGGTQATAWSLMALTNWMVASGELEADYEYAVALNGERLGGGVADSESLRQNNTLKVDVTELLAEGANRLAIAREDGPGNLYYSAHLDVSLPVEQINALDQGIILSRSYYRLDDLETPVTSARQGDLLLARLTLVAPNALHYVVVDDPLPAGLEVVDQTLSTSPQSVEVPQVYTWHDMWWRGWGWWYFNYIQKRDEKVVLSANYLPAGTYIYTYLVRAGTVGKFQTIPPTGQEFYFPEVYGRGEGSLFIVKP